MRKTASLLALLLLINGACSAKPEWETSQEAAYKAAGDEEKPILILFTGPDWCGPCRLAEARIFNKPEFTKLMEGEFILLRWDVPHPGTPEGAKAAAAAAEQFGVRGYPTVIILTPDKKPLATLMPTQYPTPEKFVEQARLAYAHAMAKKP